jgi:crotonobetainyl-CoA:carnitine CoA-transferase CaiB-like acyl-CoA transferase
VTEALEGIQVLEMATALQGPAAGGYLADMGAAVVRIEPPEGDASRFHRGVNNFHPVGTPGAQFIATSRGKRSVSMDIHHPLALEAVYRLADRADVFLSNYRESALERLGLGYETLHARNPRLVYAVASGFGDKGPDANKGMVDGAAQARGGIASVTGLAGGTPMMPGATIGDTAGAMQLALGIMTALVARERLGFGQRVAVSAYGAQIWLQMWEITQSSVTGHTLSRTGSHHPNIPGTYGVYATADGGSIFLAFARTEESWQSFCNFSGIPEIGSDERWNTLQKRMGMGNDAEGTIARQVHPYLEKAFASKTTAEWIAFLDSEPEIIYNPVYGYDEVLNDPQALANEYIVEREIPHAGRHKVVGNPIHLSNNPGTPKDFIPELGQDTELVLEELGFGWDEIEQINAATREAVRQKFIALGQEPPY